MNSLQSNKKFNRKQRNEIILHICWFALSFLIMVLSYKLGVGEFHSPRQGFFPFLGSLLLALFLLILIFRGILVLHRKDKKHEILDEARNLINIKNMLIVLASLFAYSLLLKTLGFLITTFLFLFILFWAMGSKVVLSLLFSIATVLISYFVFTYLGVRFPEGILKWIL